MSITPKRKIPIDTSYYFNGMEIEKVKYFKDLGVVFDNHMTFDNHRAYIFKKCLMLLNFGKRFSKDTNTSTTNYHFFNTYIRTHLEYCGVVWNNDDRNFKQLLKIYSNE